MQCAVLLLPTQSDFLHKVILSHILETETENVAVHVGAFVLFIAA